MAHLAVGRAVAHNRQPYFVQYGQCAFVAMPAYAHNGERQGDITLLGNHAQGFELGELAALVAHQHHTHRVSEAVITGALRKYIHTDVRQGCLKVLLYGIDNRAGGRHQYPLQSCFLPLRTW